MMLFAKLVIALSSTAIRAWAIEIISVSFGSNLQLIDKLPETIFWPAWKAMYLPPALHSSHRYDPSVYTWISWILGYISIRSIGYSLHNVMFLGSIEVGSIWAVWAVWVRWVSAVEYALFFRGWLTSRPCIYTDYRSPTSCRIIGTVRVPVPQWSVERDVVL